MPDGTLKYMKLLNLLCHAMSISSIPIKEQVFNKFTFNNPINLLLLVAHELDIILPMKWKGTPRSSAKGWLYGQKVKSRNRRK